MYVVIAIIISSVIIAGLAKLYFLFSDKIAFFLRGLDSGFKLSELGPLWKVAQICNLEEPSSIYNSMPSLSKCISHIKSQAEASGVINASRYQNLLTKLYSFRNHIEKEEDKKRGLDSTMSLSNHQKLRIILPGKGVFSSEIENNGREMTIKLPTQKNQITVEGKSWVGQSVNVYLWRTGDARYVFDTTVLREGLFMGKPALFLKHTDHLTRTQKRNAIRSKCHIYANLYILKDKVIDYNVIETKPGYKCLLEDISEKGALIRIGGKGVPNIQIRLQFQINNKLVVMFGIVRTVEFNAELKQSRLHFECIHIEPAMKNQILSYVYNIMTDSEKEIYDAMNLTDNDAMDESNEKEHEHQENMLPGKSEVQKLSDSIADTDSIMNGENRVNAHNSTLNIQDNSNEKTLQDDNSELDFNGDDL